MPCFLIVLGRCQYAHLIDEEAEAEGGNWTDGVKLVKCGIMIQTQGFKSLRSIFSHLCLQGSADALAHECVEPPHVFAKGDFRNNNTYFTSLLHKLNKSVLVKASGADPGVEWW